MDAFRLWQHLVVSNRAFRLAFSVPVRNSITAAVRAAESSHRGELRFVVERALPLDRLLSGQSSRQRALELFSQLRVWDTELNSGILIYVVFADRRVEIIADRGINARVPPGAWDVIAEQMGLDYAAGRFAEGSIAGLQAAGDLLAAAWPEGGDNPDELDNAVLVIE